MPARLPVLVLCLLLGVPLISRADSLAQCKDNAINQCFGTCTDPLTFSECVLGCGVANYESPAQCTSSCNGDPTCLRSCLRTLVSIGNCSGAGQFQVSYATNLNVGDSVINLTNTGANDVALNGSGSGNICANVYAFSPDEQLVACCSCLITPNGLVSVSIVDDLISNTLTPARPTSLVIKLVSTGAGLGGSTCSNSAATAGSSSAFPAAAGLLAWGTTLHATPSGRFALTENPYTKSTLSLAELDRINTLCGFMTQNGSGYGICRSCRAGGLGAAHR